MEISVLISDLLIGAGLHLPGLIALGIALVMVLYTPKGRVRSVALWALTVLMLTQLVEGLASVLPKLLLTQFDISELDWLMSLLMPLYFGISLLRAVGHILLAWALVQALRGQRPDSKG